MQNVATGITTPVTTNADGYYTAANLLPGDYQITVSAKGFATEVRKGISLTVGAQQVIDLTLQVGSAAHTVVEVDRKSTRLNSSHQIISYAVFCLKKKKHTQRYGLTITAPYSLF